MEPLQDEQMPRELMKVPQLEAVEDLIHHLVEIHLDGTNFEAEGDAQMEVEAVDESLAHFQVQMSVHELISVD